MRVPAPSDLLERGSCVEDSKVVRTLAKIVLRSCFGNTWGNFVVDLKVVARSVLLELHRKIAVNYVNTGQRGLEERWYVQARYVELPFQFPFVLDLWFLDKLFQISDLCRARAFRAKKRQCKVPP